MEDYCPTKKNLKRKKMKNQNIIIIYNRQRKNFHQQQQSAKKKIKQPKNIYIMFDIESNHQN